MNFKDWFNEDDHDLYNFPKEAMEAAWDKATEIKDKRIVTLETALQEIQVPVHHCGEYCSIATKALEDEPTIINPPHIESK
jgi:hypothetical protein